MIGESISITRMYKLRVVLIKRLENTFKGKPWFLIWNTLWITLKEIFRDTIKEVLNDR